jgi:4-hydroxymandelate oxidase
LLAEQHGVDGIVVSNHGGHALPASVGTLDTLGRVVDALGDTAMEILVDGGVRRGTDVLKALAVGAKAVMIGRPVYWGLSHGGADGVGLVLDILSGELEAAMSMCGITDLQRVPRSLTRAAQRVDQVERLERLVRLERDGYVGRAEFERLKVRLIDGAT